MSSDLCATFRELAERTHLQLEIARQVAHQPLEESITDWNILALKHRHPDEIYTRTYNRREEGTTGADWEWWISDSSRSLWLGLRVQAKILNLKSNRFEHLHYRSGKRKRVYQVSRLKRDAAANGTIPLYCLYLENRVPPHHMGLYPAALYGCSLLAVEHVERLRKNGRVDDLASVLSNAFPWHTLVCDSMNRGMNPLLAAMMLLGLAVAERRLAADDTPPILRDSPPPYVRAILQQESSENSQVPIGLAGVLVIAPKPKRHDENRNLN